MTTLKRYCSTGETLADTRHPDRNTYSSYGAVALTSDHDYAVVFI